MNRQKREIKEEGEIVLLSNGMECANPRFKIMGQNERLFTQLVAKLGLSAESRSAGQRNAISTGSAMVKPTAKTGKVNWQAEAKKIK